MSNGKRTGSPLLRGFLLIILGVIFLLYRFDPALGIGHLFTRYWPVLIILWGVARLIEHFAPQQAGAGRPAFLSGAEAALLVAVIVVLFGMAAVDIMHRRMPNVDLNLDFSGPYTQTQKLAPQTIPADARVTIQTNRGSITVHAGAGDDLVVTANKSAGGASESAAQERMEKTDVTIEHSGDGYVVHPNQQDTSRGRISVDLDVQVPKGARLTVNTDRGDVHVTGMSNTISATTRNGDIEIRDAGSNVTATLEKGDAHIVGVAGDVNVTGRGSEIEISNVTGDAAIRGNFFGPIRTSNIGKTVQCSAQQSDVTLVHLTGRMVLDSGRLEVSGTTGPASISTRRKDISVEDIAGRLNIADSHGDIQVRYSKPPREEINIADETGEVSLTLPANSSFEISADSRSGEAQSDFTAPSLNVTSNGQVGALSGKVGSGGPKISIATTYGTIRLRKTS